MRGAPASLSEFFTSIYVFTNSISDEVFMFHGFFGRASRCVSKAHGFVIAAKIGFHEISSDVSKEYKIMFRSY